MLRRSAFALYSLTGTDKYYTLSVFAANLEGFFHSLYTHPRELREILEKNMDVLDSISPTIEEFIKHTRRIDGLIPQDIETLKNLSERLSY